MAGFALLVVAGASAWSCGGEPAAAAAVVVTPVVEVAPDQGQDPAPDPAPAVQEAVTPAAFLALVRERPPETCSDDELSALILTFARFAASRTRLPVPDREQRAIAQRLLAAAGRLEVGWLDYLEYSIACGAPESGSLADMQVSCDRLLAFTATHPDSAYEVEMLLLIADLQRGLGNPGDALRTLDRVAARAALPTARRSTERGIRADVLRESGQLDAARVVLAESLQLAFESGDDQAIESALLRDQELALASGQFDASLRAIEDLLARLPDGADSARRRAELLVCRGFAEAGIAGAGVHVDLDALATARATLATARAQCDGHLRIRADLKLYDLALRAGDPDAAEQARRCCDESMGMVALVSPLPRDAVERIGFDTQLSLLRGDGAEALRAQRERQLFAQQELAREWRDQPAGRGGIGFLHPTHRRELLGAGIRLELALARGEHRDDGAARALQALLDLQTETSLARARQVQRTTVAELQQVVLAADRAALVLLPTRAETFAFLIGHDRVRLEVLDGALVAQPAVAELLLLLARPAQLRGEARQRRERELDANGAAARAYLLPGALGEAVSRLQALTVVGTDLIGGLPFEALPLADGRLLGEVVAIDHEASLPLLVQMVRQASPPTPRADARLLLVACTDPDAAAAEAGGVAGFEFPRGELAAALDAYPPHEERIGAGATRAALLQADLASFDVVHVVAHHARREDPERGAGILLRDAAVWRSELAATRLRGLCLISSCSGGAGPGRLGEGFGFASVAGGCLWAGARAVVASRADLLVLDHLRLLRSMHQHLLVGDSPARALQRARAAAAVGADLLTRTQNAMVQVSGAGQLPVFGP